MVLFSKIEDEIELHQATLAGIIGGFFVTFLFGTVIFRILTVYGAATNLYDRELDVVFYPYLPTLMLTGLALTLTLIFWRWKSRLAIIILLGLYLLRFIANFIVTGGEISPFIILSFFIVLLLITGIRAAFYIKKMQSDNNPDVFD